jgi:hypothetical protein
MLSADQTSLTNYPFKHRANEADLGNVDEVFDGNQASRLDKDLFWSINAVAMEITDIIEIIHAHYEIKCSGGAA